MKKMICLVLTLMCLMSGAALADRVSDTNYMIGFLNHMMTQVYGIDDLYVSGGELEGIGMNYANEDGSLVLLLVTDAEGVGYDTGVIICTDSELTRYAMNTLVTMSMTCETTLTDAMAVAEWFDGQYADVQACFDDPAFDDGSEGSGIYAQEFFGDNGMYSELTVMRVDGDVRMNITFDFRPSIVFPTPEA